MTTLQLQLIILERVGKCIHGVIPRKTNCNHFWKLTLPSMCTLDWSSTRNECCRTDENFYMPNLMIRLARQQIVQDSLSSRQWIAQE